MSPRSAYHPDSIIESLTAAALGFYPINVRDQFLAAVRDRRIQIRWSFKADAGRWVAAIHEEGHDEQLLTWSVDDSEE